MRTGQVYEQGPDELDIAIGDWIISEFDRRPLRTPPPKLDLRPMTEAEYDAIEKVREVTHYRYQDEIAPYDMNDFDDFDESDDDSESDDE